MKLINIKKVDDLDGSSIGDIDTTAFALDGVDYEIDLTVDNLRALRAALAPYIAVARPSLTPQGASAPASSPSPRRRAPTVSAQEIRTWARQAGYYMSAQGPIPIGIREAHKLNLPQPPLTATTEGWLAGFVSYDEQAGDDPTQDWPYGRSA